MSFNVNFLGGIPYNPDNLHIPQNDKDSKIGEGRILGYSFNQMFRAYWTVRSFEIRVGVSVIDSAGQLAQFIQGGGTSAGIIGAGAGLASITQPKNGFLDVRGHTKIYSKYNKKVRIAREGIIDSKTQADIGGSRALDLDEDIDPNKLVSNIYGTNEGTLCSAGPVHIFSEQNVSITLDFSDIKYFRFGRTRFYWPKILIYIAVPEAEAVFGNTVPSNVALGSIGFTNSALSFINLNVPNTTVNLGQQQIQSQLRSTQIANVTIDIRPGKRCCDRFLWDGKDNEREQDEDTKTPNPNSEESCKDVCGYDEKNGVYFKKVKKSEGS